MEFPNTLDGPKKVKFLGITYYLSKHKYYHGGYNRESRLSCSRSLHREIWSLHNSAEIPKKHHIHHKNHNRLDNSPDNLECVSSSNHLLEHWRDKTQTRLECQICGTGFMAWFPTEARFCSMICRQRQVRRSGRYDVEKTCPICLKKFMVDKYVKTVTCSVSCGCYLRAERAKRL